MIMVWTCHSLGFLLIHQSKKSFTKLHSLSAEHYIKGQLCTFNFYLPFNISLFKLPMCWAEITTQSQIFWSALRLHLLLRYILPSTSSVHLLLIIICSLPNSCETHLQFLNGNILLKLWCFRYTDIVLTTMVRTANHAVWMHSKYRCWCLADTDKSLLVLKKSCQDHMKPVTAMCAK